MTSEMRLAQTLDLGAAQPLWSNLNALRGQPVQVDASEVERMGGLCLQVLVAAAVQWRGDGVAFTVSPASPAFCDAVRLMGAEEYLPAERGS